MAVALKLCEEAGEVGREIGLLCESRVGNGDAGRLADEIGDVINVLLRLCSFYGFDFGAVLVRGVERVTSRPAKPSRL